MDQLAHLKAALADRYHIERELGGGGMSRVYLATETALGRRVVIKVLLPELAAGVSVQRFAREIRLAASLQHPNVVPVFTAGEADSLPFYTMPFISGASLRERLVRSDRVGIPEAVGLLRDVARALSYAHEQGIVHRDIKPENVLLAGEAAVVTDFGIAKAISAARAENAEHHVATTLTQAGTSLGTPAYMAPEQITAEAGADHRADLYSFGCLAYEVLAGQTPFGDRPPRQLIAAHLSEAPPPLGERCTQCPPVLGRLVMQCLEKEPERRPQSARDVLRLLESVIGTSTPPGRFRSRLSRGQRIAALAAAGVLLAAGSLAAWRWLQPGRNAAEGPSRQAVATAQEETGGVVEKGDSARGETSADPRKEIRRVVGKGDSAKRETSADPRKDIGRVIDTGNNVKGKTSADPRAELASLGIAWTTAAFVEALVTSDARAVPLFLAGGMTARTDHVGAAALLYILQPNLPDPVPMLELFLAAGYDPNATLIDRRIFVHYSSNLPPPFEAAELPPEYDSSRHTFAGPALLWVVIRASYAGATEADRHVIQFLRQRGADTRLCRKFLLAMEPAWGANDTYKEVRRLIE